MLYPILFLAFAAAPSAVVPEPGFHVDPALSADGRTLVYASASDASPHLQLWLRQMPDGAPRQLTSGNVDSHQPSITPGGQTIAYRSEAKGGGVFLLPTAGGRPRLAAAGGHHPRFSPDGRRLVYRKDPAALFLMDPATGVSQPVPASFAAVTGAVWSPDGDSLLVSGCLGAAAATCGWYLVAPAGASAPVDLNAAAVFAAPRFATLPTPDLWLSRGGTVVCTAISPGGARLWKIALTPNPWRLQGQPERLLTAETDQRWPAAANSGAIIYTSRSDNIDVFLKPIDANRAQSRGPATRLTTDPAIDQRPVLSQDGRRVAWETSRGGNFEVWVKELPSGDERAITSGPLREHMPAISRDGSQLVYDAHDGEKVTVFLAPFAGGAPRPVIEEHVGHGSFQFTADGRSVLYFHRQPPGSVGLLDLAAARRTPLLRHPALNLSLHDARLSPDNNWIVFTAPIAPHRTRLALAPVTDHPQTDEKLWTWLHPDSLNSDLPEWSPNGRFLYFLSDKSGTLAAWALPIGADHKPGGPPRLIHQFATRRVSIAEMRPRDIGLAVAADKLALGATTYSASLWSIEP